jgi:hypothetical protein
MRTTIFKTLIAGLSAISLMASVLATAQPAGAANWHGGGWHGAGGWHGGGWHGGRWHGGAGWAGPAVVGGLAAGALLAAPYYTYGYGNGCYSYQPIYDAYGNYIGRQLVNVC